MVREMTPDEFCGMMKAMQGEGQVVNPLEEFLNGCDGNCEECDMPDKEENLPWDANLPFMMSPFAIDRVEFQNPATIVWWTDGTKTVVRCMDNAEEKIKDGKKMMKARPSDTYSKEVGLAMCIAKKAYGNTGYFNEIFKCFIPEYDNPKTTVYVEEEDKGVVEVTGTGTLRKLPPEEAKEVQEKFFGGGTEEVKKPKRATNIDDGKIKALSNAGWTAEKIAEEMNISVATVYNHLKAMREE